MSNAAPIDLSAPPGCDAEQFGEYPSVLDGRCRCMTCARCGHHSTNAHQGHHWTMCSVTGELREPHFCCPDPAFGCELEQPTSSLAGHLAWLKLEDCTCSFKWKSLGRLEGDGWVRMTTEPGCPEHGTATSA